MALKDTDQVAAVLGVVLLARDLHVRSIIMHRAENTHTCKPNNHIKCNKDE